MKSYVTVLFNPVDQGSLKEYSAKAASIISKFGGKFLAKGLASSLHGSMECQYQAIIEFSDRLKAEEWYHSDEYQSISELRDRGMISSFFLIG